MAGGGGGQQPQGDHSLGPLWITVLLFVAGWVIWYYTQEYIVAFVFRLKLYEINFVNLFTNQLAPLESAIRAVPTSEYGNVSFDTIVSMSRKVGEVMRYPVIVIIGVLAAIIYTHSPVLRYKKTYDMQKLVDDESHNWPQIMPVTKLDLIKTPVTQGPWAMAMTPMEFAKKHKLLVEEEVALGEMELAIHAKLAVSVIRTEAHKAFVMQLGPFWEGVEVLPIHTQAIFAILAAKIGGDKAEAARITGQISASANSGKLDFTGVDELVRKHKSNKHIVAVTQKHAFVLTVMASLLMLCRSEGVFATSDFLWLKPVDRVLWFMLNCSGRQTPFAEVAGPFAHWLAEQKFGRRMMVPMVEEAITALESAIKEVVYKPDKKEDEKVKDH